MNPYVLTGLVMCLVVVIALIATSYLAVYFTKRGKADLERLLTPLADVIGGQCSIDEAEIRGTWQRNMVIARMANAAAGTVRVFQIDMIDPAGGVGWNYVYSRPKKDSAQPEILFHSTEPEIRSRLPALDTLTIEPLRPNERDWLQLECDPGAGHIRIVRPMRGRTEIPSPERFRADLEYLANLCDENRALQEGTNAS